MFVCRFEALCDGDKCDSAWEHACVCVCVCERIYSGSIVQARERERECVCVCVCMCVCGPEIVKYCVIENERESEKDNYQLGK